MAHFSRVSKVVIDIAPGEHDREVEFWRAATGQPLRRYERHPEYHGGELPGTGMELLTQRLDDGASRVREVHGWWIMRDPAGLLFCVIPQNRGELDETNAHRWE